MRQTSRRAAKNPDSSAAALVGPDPSGDRELVVEAGVGAEVVEGAARPALRVGGSEDESAHSGCDQGTCAHRARLERDHQSDAGERRQPPSTAAVSGEDQDLRVAVRSRRNSRLLPWRLAHHPVPEEGDRPDRHVAVSCRRSGLIDGERHGDVVGQCARAGPRAPAGIETPSALLICRDANETRKVQVNDGTVPARRTVGCLSGGRPRSCQ